MPASIEPGTKPSIIIVPGGFHGPFHYHSLADQLKSASYKVISLSLPSISDGTQQAPLDFGADVQQVRNAILHEAEEAGIDTVLVMHSYGGIPGTEACKGLSKAERQGEGLLGGVIALCYVAAYAVPVGRSLASYLVEFGKVWPDYYVFEGYGNAYIRPSPDAPSRYYSDIDPSSPLSQSLSTQLQLQAKGSFESELSYPAWSRTPVTYLLTTEDPAMPIWLQERFCEHGTKQAVKDTWTVVRIASGHCPWLRFPEETSNIIRRTAGERF